MDKRKRSRIVSRAITISVLAGAALLIALGFMPKPVPASVAKVERRALEVAVEEPGRTRIRDKHVVAATVAGRLARIELKAGDRVEQGDVVAQIAPAVPQLLDERTRAQHAARVAVAEANVARARAATRRAETAQRFASEQAERARKLQAQGGTSEQALERAVYEARTADEELATARVSAQVALGELAAARAALASAGGGGGDGATLPILAPISGQVLDVLTESEGVVQPGTPLIELGDPRALEIVVNVLSSDAVGIPVGAPAYIERWGGEGTLEARVRRIEPSAFTTRSALGVEEQRVPVLLDLVDPEERWRGLGDGYRVEARIVTKRVDGAIAVPASALFREDGGSWTFVVRDDKAHKVRLETGARTPDWVEVVRGLSEGERVVIYPSDQVADGVELATEAGERRME